MNHIFGANMLRMKPVAAIRVPRTVTNLHPNLFTRTLAMGPVQEANSENFNNPKQLNCFIILID